MSSNSNDLILHLMKCYQSCTETITHCLDMGGDHADTDHINLMLDCAKICHVAADFNMRGSDHQTDINSLCADICRECAAECKKLSDGDDPMERCAEICLECADACSDV